MGVNENLGRAILALGTDDSGLDSGLGKAEGKSRDWVKTVGGVLGGLAIGAAVVKGVDMLVGGLKDSVSAAMEAEEIQGALQAVLTSTGGKAGVTADAVNELSQSLSEVTRFEDDAIVAGENMLLTFTNIGKDVFPAATETMLNMSQALGQDMQSSAIQLGKALNDPIAGVSALRKVGVALTEDQEKQIKALVGTSEQLEKLGKEADKAYVVLEKTPGIIALETEKLQKMTAGGKASALQIQQQRDKISGLNGDMASAKYAMDLYAKAQADAADPVKQQNNLIAAQKIILGELETEFGGAAKAAGQTFAGQMDILNNALGNVKEEVGGALIPILSDLATKYGPLLIEFAKQAGQWLTTSLVPAIEQVVTWLSANLPPAIETAKGVFATIGTVIDAVRPYIDTLIGVFVGLGKSTTETGGWIQTTWQQIQAIIDAVLPHIQSIITTIFGAVASFLDEHGAKILSDLQGAWQTVQGIITVAIKIIDKVLREVFGAIARFLSEHGDEIKQALTNAWTIIQNVVQGALDFIKGILTAALQILQGDWKGAWETIKQTLEDTWTRIKTIVSTALDQMKLSLSMAWDVVKGGVQSVLDWLGGLRIPNPFQGILDVINSVISRAQQAMGTLGIPRFATGTSYAPGGLALVGEQGPEVVALPRGSRVWPEGQGPGGGGINITINAPGGDPGAVQAGVLSGLSVARARGLL